MTMTHDEMVEVILAHKDGKEIQERYTTSESWSPFAGSWFFDCIMYRVKPEPKVIWVNEYKHGAVAVYKNKIDATTATTAGNYGDMMRVAVKYQEVIK